MVDNLIDKLKEINPWVWVIIVIVLVLLFWGAAREPFAESGLTMSDEYCHKLMDIYYDPRHTNIENEEYRSRLCGRIRRYVIDPPTGNYYSRNGVFI